MFGIIALIGLSKLHDAMTEMKKNREEDLKRIEKLERGQVRSNAKLAKHDQQIKEVQFKINQAEKDIQHLRIDLDDLRESFELACQEADRCHHAGDVRGEEKAKERVRVKRNQIHAAEKRLDKAMHDKAAFCERLEVA